MLHYIFPFLLAVNHFLEFNIWKVFWIRLVTHIVGNHGKFRSDYCPLITRGSADKEIIVVMIYLWVIFKAFWFIPTKCCMSIEITYTFFGKKMKGFRFPCKLKWPERMNWSKLPVSSRQSMMHRLVIYSIWLIGHFQCWYAFMETTKHNLDKKQTQNDCFYMNCPTCSEWGVPGVFNRGYWR